SASASASAAPPSSSLPVLAFNDVSCVLGGKNVVDGVSFTIEAGQIICLMGESGCGKTTCLRLAGGIETPSAGAIYLNGECVSTPDAVVPPEKRGLGFLFQDYALFPHLSVYENVCFGIGNLPKDERKARANTLLEAVGLADFANSAPATLSGGEQQRVALARALAPRPHLVLMDEPFSGLDLPQRDAMRDLTKRLLKASGAAGLIVSHDVADAFRVADFIAVQKAGQILAYGTPQDLYDNSRNPEVMRLLGQTLNTMTFEGEAIGFFPYDISLMASADDFGFTACVAHYQPAGLGTLYFLKTHDDTGADTLIQALMPDDIALGTSHNFYVPRARLVLLKGEEANKERTQKWA
ncbi:MAG: ABC transporter ATP-binding protein, partial [Alphaproteobacteria bacterium]|nr:ABC transporter ATP-binding protein [Alphaproteobacteria bacterium]